MLDVNFVGKSEDGIHWFLVHGEKRGQVYRRHFGLVYRNDVVFIMDAEHKPLPTWEIRSIRPLLEATMRDSDTFSI